MMPSCVQCPARAAAAAEATPPSSSHQPARQCIGAEDQYVYITPRINHQYALHAHFTCCKPDRKTNDKCHMFYAKLTTEPGTFMAYLVFDGLLY